jgi:hypothetical protein
LRGFERKDKIYFDVMEVPRIYREQPNRVRFVGEIKEDKETGMVFFKYPGGEVPVIDEEDFSRRLSQKGFNDEQVIEIINNLLSSSVAAEATISFPKVLQSRH